MSSNANNKQTSEPQQERFNSVLEMVKHWDTATPENAPPDALEAQQTFDRLEETLAAKEIAHFLFALRNAAGVTQQQMAERMQCTQSRISKLENSDDVDLKYGELRDYLAAIDKQLHLVVFDKDARLVDRIKFHVFAIRESLDQLRILAGTDQTIRPAVQDFHLELLYNVLKTVLDSAAHLPSDIRNQEDPIMDASKSGQHFRPANKVLKDPPPNRVADTDSVLS